MKRILRILRQIIAGLERRWYGKDDMPGYHRLAGLKPVNTVIDIGVGHNGSPFLYRHFPDATYLSVDPLREAEQAVAKGLGRSDNSLFIEAALGEEPATIDLPISRVPSRTTLLEPVSRKADRTSSETRRVEIRRLDDITEGLDLPKPVLLKVDTEGYEMKVLKGAEKTLKNCSYVILELSFQPRFKDSYTFEEMIAFMASSGFTVHSVITGGSDKVDLCFSSGRLSPDQH